MFNQVDLDAALAEKWDVIIAGTSFAAMFFSRALPNNLKILFVEKGTVQVHDDQLRSGTLGRETLDQENTSDHEKIWVAHSKFGGNSNCWWGQTPRFHPNDFSLKTLYGIGQDWPLNYDDLEPFYGEVERVMEIAGGGNEHILPRSTPFPFPPHASSLSDQYFQVKRPDIWFPAPTARSNGGSRTPCCSNGVCSLCPIDAKFTILNGIGAFERRGAALLLGSEVRAIHIENGQAKGVEVCNEDGRTVELKADVIALGTNAFFNVAIMLRSGIESPALGRYIHEQASRDVSVDVAIKNYYGGTSITGHCYGLYDGEHRRENGGVMIENYNAPSHIRHEPGKWTQRLHLKFIVEDLPQAKNRVVLGEDGEPRILWHGHSEYASKGLKFAENNLASVLPVEIEAMFSHPRNATEAHIQGTHRMGNDPTTSVVDTSLRTHAVENLFALGAGAFPSCSPANPTLTLSALSMRAGETLK